MTVRQQEHAEYLRTPEWAALRRAALHAAGHRCQLCNSGRGLNVHHRTYERWRQELPSDLTVLCRGCHERFHKPKRKKQHTQGPGRLGRWIERQQGSFTTLDAVAALGYGYDNLERRLASLATRGKLLRVDGKFWTRVAAGAR